MERYTRKDIRGNIPGRTTEKYTDGVIQRKLHRGNYTEGNILRDIHGRINGRTYLEGHTNYTNGITTGRELNGEKYSDGHTPEDKWRDIHLGTYTEGYIWRDIYGGTYT